MWIPNSAMGLASIVVVIRAIINLFCDLQSARYLLFQRVAQVINSLKFIIE